MRILDAFKLLADLCAVQTDLAGRPYIEHAVRVYLRVCELGGDRDQQFAALFHDVIEDGKATAEKLLEAGVPAGAVSLVLVLTRKKGQPYLVYIEGIKAEPRAVLPKQADLEDNSDPARLALLDEATASRLRQKYAQARELLAA